VLAFSMGTMEAPVLARLLDAWKAGDATAARACNETFLASRETSELRAETLQMCHSLRALLHALDRAAGRDLDDVDGISFPMAFARAAVEADVDAEEALCAYMFAWLENQVLAAVKSVPLGQTDGQRMLRDLAARIPWLVAQATALGDDDLANFVPGLALISSRH